MEQSAQVEQKKPIISNKNVVCPVDPADAAQCDSCQ